MLYKDKLKEKEEYVNKSMLHIFRSRLMKDGFGSKVVETLSK